MTFASRLSRHFCGAPPPPPLQTQDPSLTWGPLAFKKLPADVVEKVAAGLSDQELSAAAQACHAWHEATSPERDLRAGLRAVNRCLKTQNAADFAQACARPAALNKQRLLRRLGGVVDQEQLRPWLSEMAANGNLQFVRLLCQQGVLVDKTDAVGFNAARWAQWNGHPEVVAELAHWGCGPNQLGEPVPAAAVRTGNAALLGDCMQRSPTAWREEADLHALVRTDVGILDSTHIFDFSSDKPMPLSLVYQRAPNFETLVAAYKGRGSIHGKLTQEGSTLLHALCSNPYLDLPKALKFLGRQVFANVINDQGIGSTPLHVLLYTRPDDTAAAKSLIAYGANPNANDEMGNSCLDLVARYAQHPEVAIGALLESGAHPVGASSLCNLMNRPKTGASAIILFKEARESRPRAALNQDRVPRETSSKWRQAAQLLVERGVNPNHCETGVAPLLRAAQSQHNPLEKCQFLFRHGANPQIQDRLGIPLFLQVVEKMATTGMHAETLAYLLHGGANIEAESDSWGLLELTLPPDGSEEWRAQLQVYCTHLLPALAKHPAQLQTSLGVHAIHVAALLSKDDPTPLLKFLLDQGAGVNAVTRDAGWSPLHFLLHNGDYPEAATLLLARGADLTRTTTDAYRENPVQLAKRLGRQACLGVLTFARA